VAIIDGKYVIIDGVHRIRAMELLSGMKHGNIKVELLGEITEEQAFEEAVRRNAIHGSPFARGDLKKIVQTFEKYGRDLTYASDVLKMSRDRLDFKKDAKRTLSYPSGKKEKKEEASPLGMGLDELVSWTIKFVREGKVGEESIDKLTQLRDEINDFLERRRKAIKEERKERAVVTTEADETREDAGAMEAESVIMTDSVTPDERGELLRNALDVLEGARGVPLTEENAAGRGITVAVLAGAIKAYYSSRGEKRDDDFRAEAWHVLSFFGQNGQCYDNSLEAEDRQMMYELEDMGYVRSESQDIMLHNSKPWRMTEWFLVPERILRAYDSLKEEKQELIYEDLPEEVWAR